MSVSTKTSIEAAIIWLAKMTVPQLPQRHAELFGEETRTATREARTGGCGRPLSAAASCASGIR